jgi:hypothetical protein
VRRLQLRRPWHLHRRRMRRMARRVTVTVTVVVVWRVCHASHSPPLVVLSIVGWGRLDSSRGTIDSVRVDSAELQLTTDAELS